MYTNEHIRVSGECIAHVYLGSIFQKYKLMKSSRKECIKMNMCPKAIHTDLPRLYTLSTTNATWVLNQCDMFLDTIW